MLPSRTRAALPEALSQAAAPEDGVLAFAALRLPVAPPVAAIIAAVAVTTAARSMVVLRMVSNLSQEGDSETLWALAWTVPR